jgi:hypothetical protein
MALTGFRPLGWELAPLDSDDVIWELMDDLHIISLREVKSELSTLKELCGQTLSQLKELPCLGLKWMGKPGLGL